MSAPPGADSGTSGGQGNDSPPAFVGTVQHDRYLDRPHDVEVEGTLAYLPGKGGSFGIVDVSDPTNPAVLGGIAGLENAQTVGIGDPASLVYVSEGESVHAVSVDPPADPTIVGTASARTLSRINGWAEYRDRLFTASKRGWLGVVDVREPRNPTVLDAFDLTATAGVDAPHDVARCGDHLVVPNQPQGAHPKGCVVRAFDDGRIRDADDFEVVGTFDHPRLDGCNRVVVDGTDAFVANNYSHTVAVVDCSTPTDPTITCVADATEEGPNGLCLTADSLLAGSGRYVDWYGRRDPHALEQTDRIDDPDRFEAPGSAHDLEVARGYLYVSAQAANRLNVYEVPV
jgi:hypothetical protein